MHTCISIRIVERMRKKKWLDGITNGKTSKENASNFMSLCVFIPHKGRHAHDTPNKQKYFEIIAPSKWFEISSYVVVVFYNSFYIANCTFLC